MIISDTDPNREWTRQDLLDLIHLHIGWNVGVSPSDDAYSLAKFVTDHPDCVGRTVSRGSTQLTVSGWILDETLNRVLLINHRKLGQWLPPGGHVEREFNLLKEAMRECREETGLKSIVPVAPYIFDTDVHQIPQHGGTPEHHHVDVCFLLRANSSESFSVAGREIADIKWFPFTDASFFRRSAQIPNGRTMRLVQKCLVPPPAFNEAFDNLDRIERQKEET